MDHHSIAIIRKKKAMQPGGHAHYSYLAILDPNNRYSFFETINRSIGATFDYTSFMTAILRYFELKDDPDRRSTEFETPPQPFKLSKRDPYATSYICELSEGQTELINERIKQAGDSKWNKIEWVDESAIKSLNWREHQKFLFLAEEPFKQPRFTNEFRADLTKIVEAKNNGKLVIFAGAGLSYDSGVPGWNELISELRADLTTSENDPLIIAQQYFDTRGHKEYYEKLLQVLKYNKTTFNVVHQKITDLSPIHIVTTNYDKHFEQIIDEKVLGYSTIRTDADLPFAKGSSLYVKMHGDLGIKRIVLKRNDYDEYPRNFPLIESFIKETFASKLVLFLGFSFEDPNLEKILGSVQEILRSDIQKPYLFSGSISSESKRQKWSDISKKGVKIISYNPELGDYFNQVSLEEDIENLKKVSKQGQEVYTFLRVVEDFDPASDGIDNLEMPKQIINSIRRFEGLGAIPIPILKQISPFKLKREPTYDTTGHAEYSAYQPFHLQTANEELLVFLKKQKGAKSHLEYSVAPDGSGSSEDQKLNRSFKTLVNSGIECFIRKNDTSTEHIKLEGINGKEKCNCLRCLNRNLQFRELIQTLASAEAKALCGGNQMDEKLLEAFVYYKTSQPIKCFYALEAARNKSLKEQNYIAYFIASYNQTKILNLVRYRHESEIEARQIDLVAQKIGRLDIYDLLTKLPVESIVRQCLRYILEDRACRDDLPYLKDEFKQISENYRLHRRSGYTVHGPTTWYNFQARFYLIWNFYHQNLLFNDNNYEFNELAELYIEGMLISYATSIRYKQRLTEIPEFFNEISILYGDPHKLKSFFETYKIDTLNQYENNESLLDNFHSFLDSGYDKTNFLGESVGRNILFDALVSRSYSFQGKVVYVFNNNLVLLQHVKLNRGQINTTIDKVIDFLSVSNAFGAVDSLKYLSDFVSCHMDQIDETQIHKILKFALSDNIWPGPVILSISRACGSINRTGFLGKDILLRVLRRIDERREWPMDMKEALPLFPLLIPDQKQEFLTFINAQFFGAQIPHDILKYGYAYGMWNPIDDSDKFQRFFDAVVAQAGSFPNYKIRKTGRVSGSHFQPWNDFFFTLRLLYKYDLWRSDIASQLYNKTAIPMFKWILRPQEFNYEEFQLKWALVFRDPDILKVTKSVPGLIATLQKKLRRNFNLEVYKAYFSD